MGWLAETNVEVSSAFGEYGQFGPVGGLAGTQHSARTVAGPVVHLLDETSFLLVFVANQGDVANKLFAVPGAIAADGSVTLNLADTVEVADVTDLATDVVVPPQIETVQALPDGGYAVYVVPTAEGSGGEVQVFSVPDPAAAAAYSTVATDRTFMGDQLVEFTYDSGAGEIVLTQIGDTSEVSDPGDYVEIARTSAPDDTFIALDNIFASPAATVCMVVTQSIADGVNYSNLWIVETDGSNTTTRIGEGDQVPIVLPDQRLNTTDLRWYPTPADIDVDPVNLASLPTETPIVTHLVDTDTENIEASTWAAFLIGDIDGDATQPEPGDPFDETSTISGHHLPSDDAYIYFSFFEDDGGDIMPNWDGAVIEYTTHDYAGTIPDVYLGINGVNSQILLLDGATTVDSDDLGSSTVTAINQAYFQSPGNPPAAHAGQLILFWNPALFPSVPEDFFIYVDVTVTKTVTITPTAAHRYKQGQYRYLNATSDNTSTYDGDHTPGTEYMASDFYDTPAGRWTLVVGMLQDADNYGGENQVSFAVHFESFVAAGVLKPLRQWPRSDALGAGSSRRMYPVSPSYQASNRRGPSAIL